MSSVKERLFGAITVMTEADAQKLWDFVLAQAAWNSIEEVEPDEIDLQMLREVQSDLDCQIMATDDEVEQVLG